MVNHKEILRLNIWDSQTGRSQMLLAVAATRSHAH